ncbi:2-(1,2-epoxy-1,2-dihydrophenyl)acetyl-CoA isomerase [Halalkalibacillus sediminis]|uniref:2-(1,2-epoxy-1,2-dihydrophenyl)acetyl-CoA isomerase n=1 Tax=Halalkalibacillus sediminis TaxID=2018042 RepID=A0A2I0QSR8_9BACI|nr:enoyl-CoA hydratase-related protein [Halalkalibacillus sediminis]PKR77383.1 2-(1,2-epoxy-1,2-dihydrophenyl)acetyl-CoA isomerase [Halalkalibacillus sediminis]
MDFETILYSEKDGVATITLNRPKAYNAFTKEMNYEITKALKSADKNKEVRCIVFTGEGKAFCSGQDLQDVDEDTNHAEFLRTRYQPMLKQLKDTAKPIVAAVNGTAAGAGMSLALACDFRLMKSSAKFLSAFVGIGLVPDSGMMYHLPRLIGYAKAMEMIVLGKPMTATEAHDLGLVTEVVEENEWDEKVNEFTQNLASMPTKSIALVKRYMMDSMHESYDEFLEKEAFAQRIAGQSEDHREGVQAFKEKRQPTYTGQ